ncbi:26S proteasome regulatory subunit T6 [Strigomonas culicis]|uniref:26S proteasome regulatory subunit T6 n=1 Tax=Strigomonas culicis TaxID=28005 RepID=S9VWD7_9TRYP|nr:26S proteasome regulatory subunit T6 [Strigomonas culicis]EPY28597.1 26S proteasome regulatory subunit T6 [Strigomonas culicis]EPY31371.1 26S proteasome regulatory subunit T6 [Strigomonas culicis]|eukprot:EPY22683.1 26S proteasome regulatory subunit T6 [Strigomonas culicis]
MTTVAVSSSSSGAAHPTTAAAAASDSAVSKYFLQKVHELRSLEKRKMDTYQRMEAQRNDLNRRVRHLKEEVQMLQESGSVVADVVKVMGKEKVLVKVGSDQGKMVVDVEKNVELADLTPNTRVALRSGSSAIHYILPTKVDPLVSLMKVEKAGTDSTYDEIGGLSRQVKEIKEVIELPVKHPELFEALGIAQPKGVLLYGPPGTGKTLLARVVAHHTECTFIRVSGAELVQKYIGEGARMVRELFVMAREHSPSIIFMDEIDSIGSSRLESGKHDSEVQRTMLELLNQLDGFEATQSIKVIMATNRIDVLDEALLRPGRIDRKIEFPAPDETARYEILRIHSRKMNMTRGINLKKVAEKTSNCSGAEIKAVCTEAGMFALRERRVHITQEDFELAVAKVMSKDQDKNVSMKKLWK